MQTSGEDKFNAFACSGRRCPRRSEPEVAPAGRRRATHISYIIHKCFHLTPPEPNLKSRAPLRQNPGAVPETRLPPLTSPGRPARRAGTAVADEWVL